MGDYGHRQCRLGLGGEGERERGLLQGCERGRLQLAAAESTQTQPTLHTTTELPPASSSRGLSPSLSLAVQAAPNQPTKSCRLMDVCACVS